MADQTIEELEERIEELYKQKEQIEGVLKSLPSNKELQKLRDDLKNLIKEAQDVLNMKKIAENKKKSQVSLDSTNEEKKIETNNSTEIILEKDKIKKLPYEVGTKCFARWTQDGQWYDAIIESVNRDKGTFVVVFVGYGNKDEVKIDALRLSATQPPPPPSLKPEIDIKPIPIPDSLKIRKDDPLEVKMSKKKKLHAIKSKNRFKEIDAITSNKQNNWQQFVQTNHKRGPLPTLVNKKSMFSTPETFTGKVGVIGSGQGITHNRERKVEHKKTKITLPPSDDELVLMRKDFLP